jgi:hypothetical protein
MGMNQGQASSSPDPLREALTDLRDLERHNRATGVVLAALCCSIGDYLEGRHIGAKALKPPTKRRQRQR